ncbi:hypothetical protein GCK32_012851, partial [Trichostrongylus colubriformis]
QWIMWISLSVNAMLVFLSITASEKVHESNSHAEYDSDLIFTTSEEGTLEETSWPSAEMERRMSSVVANSEVPNFTSESHEASTRVSGSHATTSLPSSADESSTRDSGSHVPIVTSELHRTIRGGDVNDSLTAATHADTSKHTHPTTRSTDSIIISTPADIPATTSPNIAVLPPEAITTSAPITDTSTVPIAISVNHTSTPKSVGHTSVPTSNSHINASTPNSHTSAPSPTTFTHTTSNFETISEQESSPITIPPLTPPSSTHSARTQVENSSTAAEASRPLHTSTSDNFIQATLLLERNSLYQKRDDDDGIMVVLAIGLLLILLLILILAVLITAILVTKNQRKRKPVEDAERKSAAVYKIYDPTKRPRLMKAADMRKMHFEYKGALVLQPKLEGPVVSITFSLYSNINIM